MTTVRSKNARKRLPSRSKIPTWRFILKTALYHPELYAINLFGALLATIVQLFPGLVARSFLDSLSGGMAATINLWALVAWLVATSLGDMTGVYFIIRANVPMRFLSQALMHKNMLQRILSLPGARALGKFLNRRGKRSAASKRIRLIQWILSCG